MLVAAPVIPATAVVRPVRAQLPESFQNVGFGVDGISQSFILEARPARSLRTAAEWGVLPAVAFWVFVMGVLTQSVRTFLRGDSPERRGILLASSGAMFAILVHSLTDFNLQILSNAMLFCTGG